MNKIDLLERFYNSFINEESPKSFFSGLTDYIYFIDENPEIDSIVEKLFSEKKLFEDKLKEAGFVALKKISEIHKEFLSYINKNKIEDDIIKNALQEYNNWLNGRFFGSSTLVEELHDSLCDIVKRLYKLPEHKDFAKKHIIFWNDKINIKNYLYFKEVDDYFETLRDFKEKEEDKLWGRVLEIIHFCKVVEFGKDKHRELAKQMKGEKSSKATFEILNHGVLLAEWQAIDEGENENKEVIFFDVNKVKPTIIRFQNYLIKELDKSSGVSSEIIQPSFIKQAIEKRAKEAERDGKIEERILAKLEEKETTKIEQKQVNKNRDKEKVKKITIIKMNDGKKLVAVNDNFAETKETKDYSEWWQIFIREIEERNMHSETRSNVKTISKNMSDYFNYNTQKCPIYMNGKYKPTEIFTGRGNDARLNPDIKTEIITENLYSTRKKRKNKK